MLAEPLTFLINAFLEGLFPNHLKSASVIQIFTKLECKDPCNYGPISITPARSKKFKESIKHQNITFLIRNNVLSPSQFVFKLVFVFKLSSFSKDALHFATEKLEKKIDQNEFVTAAFLDLSNAFDSNSQSILLEKLREFNKFAISVIQSYLTRKNQKVMLNNCKSDWIETYQGVPLLGPLLFKIYIN